MASATLTGLDATIDLLERLGKQGDKIAQQASTEAAQQLRDNWLISYVSRQTGISTGVVRRQASIKKASNKYPAARINFSGAGILVRDYKHSYRVTGGNGTRAQILVNWIGGSKKVAAGFINARGQRQAALATRNSKTTKGGKTYTYNKGKMVDALGPSLAAAYLAIPENTVQSQAQARMAERVTALLDAFID